MVVQWAVAAENLSRFYGLVMQQPEKNEEVRRFNSKELFGDARLVLIEHEGTVYRLLRTRQGKLILNK